MSHCILTGMKFKVFVKETNANLPPEKINTSNKYLPVTPLTGDKAKEFYEEILKQPLSVSPDNKPQPKPKLKHHRASAPKMYKNSDLLWMSQNNDVISLNDFLSQTVDYDINIVDDFGWTPLMCASCSGAEEAVQILLDNGADPFKCDRLGNTALKLAKGKNKARIVAMLEDFLKGSEEESEDAELESSPQPFFCPTCNENFTTSKHKHESSTLHLFNCRIKTATFYGIPENNKGFQLLLREGWDKERGLGPNGTGRKFPVKAVMKKDRTGIGAPPLPNKTKGETHHTQKYESKRRRLYKRWKDRDFEKNFRLEFS